MMEAVPRTVYQPIHPSLRDRLDPEYVRFHDEYMQYIPPDESKAWDGEARTVPSLPYGGSHKVDVGHVEDVQLIDCMVRVFVPDTKPNHAFSCLLWFHGGGWAIGGPDDSNDFLTRICKDANCVVVTVDYRLAPEHPYPAAIQDGVAALQWIMDEGCTRYSIDPNRIAIGGTSAGSNLSLAVCLHNLNHMKIPIQFQLLIVPVIDNTASVDGTWESNRHAPWLTPSRMLWYRKMYMPDQQHWSDWGASPNLAPHEWLERLPPTWMAYSEHDLLAPEAMSFGEQLKSLHIPVTIYMVPGGTHSILALNGVLQEGNKLVTAAIQALKEAFDELA